MRLTLGKSVVGEMARVPKRYGKIQKQAFLVIQYKVERGRRPSRGSGFVRGWRSEVEMLVIYILCYNLLFIQ